MILLLFHFLSVRPVQVLPTKKKILTNPGPNLVLLPNFQLPLKANAVLTYMGASSRTVLQYADRGVIIRWDILIVLPASRGKIELYNQLNLKVFENYYVVLLACHLFLLYYLSPAFVTVNAVDIILSIYLSSPIYQLISTSNLLINSFLHPWDSSTPVNSVCAPSQYILKETPP